MTRVSTPYRIQREKLCYSQKRAAELVGIDKGQLNRIEQGRVEPSLGTVRKLAQLYGVTIDALAREPA